MVTGVLICWFVGYNIRGKAKMQEEPAMIRKLIAVGTHMLSSGLQPAKPPQPIVVQLDTNLVQVTSVALGHPRLAVINGRQVADGDFGPYSDSFCGRHSASFGNLRSASPVIGWNTGGNRAPDDCSQIIR
jgi:hypothetical protein